MRKVLLGFIVVSLFLIGVGCGSADEVATNAPDAGEQVDIETISSGDDNAAKELISKYFTALFTNAIVDEYNDNSKTGNIPDNIRDFISEKTILEGDGNPEIGIHLPRYISINGMTIVGYDIEIVSDDENIKKANIISDFVSNDGDKYLYFTKIYTKASVVTDEVFAKSYRKQDDNTYTKRVDIKTEEIDKMRLEMRFDVELIKEDNGFSVLRAFESDIKAGMKNRLFVFNNDNITRLPYLNLEKSADGSEYLNASDGEIYEKEKEIITDFFQRFTLLDRERMNLLSYKWGEGHTAVKEFWDTIGITSADEQNPIELNSKYKDNYPFDSLPLQNNMEQIREIKNFVVTPHPAYSEKIKLHYVNFDAVILRTNGITDDYFTYRYDYIVSLSNSEEDLLIERFMLNEYYLVQK
ncbi:MAG TPA: hypothetical protein GXZ28_11640 [Clostridiales bacterium]|nr:hypothetical protein [Clostridiales bacterium]